MVNDLARRLRSKLTGGKAAVARAELASQSETVFEEFDAAFYSARYPDVGGDPLHHFMSRGWREGRDPAPWFSTSFYLQNYPDVGEAGVNPFYHYVRHGRNEGRLTTPAQQLADERSWEVETIRQGMDADFYAEQLRGLGLDPTRLDLALHYFREGAARGLDPARDFSTSFYLRAHDDVAAAGVNPLLHYLAEGRAEGRSVGPSEIEDAAPKTDDRSLVGSAFDPQYYLASYADVALARVDPLDHFLSAGWKEGRNPNPWFSVADYLELYPDVASAGINPFLHYLMAGRTEGRLPRHDLGFRYDIIKSLQPLEARVKRARDAAPRRTADSPEKLREALQQASRLETKGLYLSISHDDFTENFGGVQLVLMRESAAVDALALDHLHLFPAAPLPIADLEADDPLIGVLLNRRRIGFFQASEIESEMRAAAPRIGRCHLVIHSIIGHKAEALVAIVEAAGCRSGWYWVHDYSSVCTGYTLLRNDVEFCGGPPISSIGCSICVYGRLRAEQIKAHELLFDRLDLTVLAPSEAALDVWKASASVVAPVKVHEHLHVVAPSKRAAKARRRAQPDRPLRVAYVGLPVTQKGWPVFKELALRFGKDPRYQFYHVGKEPQPGVPAIFKEVAVSADDLDKMVRAIEDLQIDIAVLWSIWPETFCIAAAEALRGGAAVITFKDSGNVAALVRKTGAGAVLDSEEELGALFESGEVIDLAARSRPQGLKAEFSNMTVDFIDGKIA